MRKYCLTAIITLLAVTNASADGAGLKSKEVLGITLGMTQDEVTQKMKAYDPAITITELKSDTSQGASPFTMVVLGKCKKDGAGEDLIAVRMGDSGDGKVLAVSVSHWAANMGESERIPVKKFEDSLMEKYGTPSKLTSTGPGSFSWLFDANGNQIQQPKDNFYSFPCGQLSTRSVAFSGAVVPVAANPKCGDELEVSRGTFLDINNINNHDVMDSYSVLYFNHALFAKVLQQESDTIKKNRENAAQRANEMLNNSVKNNAGPKL